MAINKPKIKYKIDFADTNKIEVSTFKCGNCSTYSEEIFSCKYNVTEYDEFAKKNVDKTKSTKICGKCKWYLETYIIPKMKK